MTISTPPCERLVAKVGGSLYDLPDLGPRLRRWLAARSADSILLVPGGGVLANVVRQLDASHGLGEEAAHWLALRSLTLATHFLAELLPGSVIVSHPGEWRSDGLAVLDSHAFAQADEGMPGALPHSWAVTSDSVAARAARVMKARRLVLLKSITIPDGMDWREAARRGWVDRFFPEALSDELQVEALNLRDY
jgi:5-(aminomethyl)-3-furanmethanol phosphate kinase